MAFASTGRPPYGAGSFEVIFFRILNGEIDLDGMHEALRPLVNRAVSRDMRARPTATELVAETGRLNLDLPWQEPQIGSLDQTGGHTVQSHTPGPGAGGDTGGRGGMGSVLGGAAAGGAAGYLLGKSVSEGWGPSHTRSGPTSTDSAWSSPSAPQTSHAHSGGHPVDDEATSDLGGGGAGRDVDDEATDDLGAMAGTERITPSSPEDLSDPQGTQRFDPGEPARQQEDPQGTMMMGRAEPPSRGPEGVQQTQFFNSPLDPSAFEDILTPVGQQGRRDTTQEFDEEDYNERGGLLSRFRRGGGDRFGDYFRGHNADDEDGEDEYHDQAWRMHPLVLIPIMLSLAGVALWFPWFGIILGVVVVAGLGALDVVKAEHARRLQTRGRRNSDGMVVALSFPWAFGRMVLRTVGFGLIYLVAGILVGMVYATMVETGNDGANYTGAFAVFVMILLSYIMPSGREARHQAVWLVERVRFHSLYLYIGVVVGLLLLTLLILSIGLGSAPIWKMGPLTGPADWFG